MEKTNLIKWKNDWQIILSNNGEKINKAFILYLELFGK